MYPLFEKAEGTLANTYANHAHNDAVEAALETRIFGLVLIGLFVTWLAISLSRRVDWTNSKGRKCTRSDAGARGDDRYRSPPRAFAR